jgi:hypothetical protein
MPGPLPSRAHGVGNVTTGSVTAGVVAVLAEQEVSSGGQQEQPVTAVWRPDVGCA